MSQQFRRKARLKFKNFIYTSIAGGLAVLLPIYLLILLIRSLLENIIKLINPLIITVKYFIDFSNPLVESVIAVIILLTLCFLGGVFLKTSLGLTIKNLVQPKLEKLPMYSILRSLIQEVTGLGDQEDLQVVLVALGASDESLSLGFVLNHSQGGSYVIFVPSVPTPAFGAIYVVPENKVFPIDIPFLEAIKFYSRWGLGSKTVLDAMKQYQDSHPINKN